MISQMMSEAEVLLGRFSWKKANGNQILFFFSFRCSGLARGLRGPNFF